MTTTDSEMMEDPVRPVIDDELVDRLMAQVDAEGLELLGPEGVLTELTSRILSRGLEVEMADHLGYEKGTQPGGVRVTTVTARIPRRSRQMPARWAWRCPEIATPRSNRS